MSKIGAFRTVPAPTLLPAALALLLIGGPLLALITRTPWGTLPSILTAPDTLQATLLSLTTATTSTLICALLGTPTALILTQVLHRSPYRALTLPLSCLLYAPVILSPVISGLALTYFWGRQGTLGNWLTPAGISIPFTPAAVILAQTFVALPFYIATAVTALRTIPTSYQDIALTEGASPQEITRTILLPLALPGLLTALLLTFARALGEYGATITFAGNIAGSTRTLPLTIELALNSNNPHLAHGTALILISIYLSTLALLALAHWLHNHKGPTP